MIKPTLSQINLISADLSASAAFYRKLGVQLPEASADEFHVGTVTRPADQEIGFDLDSTAFAQVWNTGWKGRTDLRGRIVIGFHVPGRADVDDVFRDMTGAGYRGLQEPFDAFWGARYAVIEDPDGIAVGLMSPVSPDKRSKTPGM